MDRGVALAFAFALVPLAGCVSPVLTERGDGMVAAHAAPVSRWHEGAWWAYHVVAGTASYDVALVVAKVHPDRFVLGSNVTNGFLGLPFNGTLLRPNLDPVLAGEPWRLFDFPLEPGKSWTYRLFGHDLTARVLSVDGAVAELEATSFGQRVMRYAYDADAGWFTRLAIHDPGRGGEKVVEAVLSGRGDAWDRDYYVTVPIHTTEEEYPATSTGESWNVDGRYVRLTAILNLAGDVGEFRARLVDPNGRVRQSAESHVMGAVVETRTFPGATGTWRIETLGLGKGHLRFELLGIAARGTPAASSPAEAPTFDLASVLDGPHVARTTPVLPQVGHDTRVSLPVAS